jgi:hypothetical protein
LVEVLV